MQLQTNQMYGEDPFQKVLAVPNHPQTGNGWSCSFQQLHTFVDLAVIVYPVHIDYEEEKKLWKAVYLQKKMSMHTWIKTP